MVKYVFVKEIVVVRTPKSTYLMKENLKGFIKKEKLELIGDRHEKNWYSVCLKGRIKRCLVNLKRCIEGDKIKKRERYLFMMRYYKDAVYATCPNKGGYYAHVGVVLQGPICRADNYTINSVKMFQSFFPHIHTVVSTWKGELTGDESAILKSCGCGIVESEPIALQDRGKVEKPCTINNQIYSSLAGINFLKQCPEVKYVLKIRTDMRLYKEDLMDYFIDMLALFACDCESLDKRLLCVGQSNFLVNVPFYVSDSIWFGTIDDMEKLYSIPLRTEDEALYVREKNESDVFRCKFSKEFSKAQTQNYLGNKSGMFWDAMDFDEKYLVLSSEENYFGYKFWESLNDKTSAGNLLEQYHRFIKNCLVVVDEDEVHLYTNKGYYHNWISEAIMLYRGSLRHSVWLRMYMEEHGNEKCSNGR